MRVYCLIINLLFYSNVVLGCDYEAADTALKHARATQSLTARLSLLEKSLAACNTYQAWYSKGLAHLQLQQYQVAETALKQAYGLAEDDYYAAFTIGRSAQSQYLQAKYSAAQKLADMAQQLFPNHKKIPTWLQQLRLAIDEQLEGQVVSAKSIANTLRATRSFNVEGLAAVDLRVHFDFDQHRPNQQGKAQVHELGLALHDFVVAEGYKVRVIGHTDAQGDAHYNQRLSEKRAHSVIQLLEQQFDAFSGKLFAEGRGETALRYPEDNDQAHRFNRRVEVELYQ